MNRLTLNCLESFPQQLAAHYAAIPPGFERWAPASWQGIPSEPLTAIERICHVRDIEVDGYHDRFQRTLQELNPRLAAIDSERLAQDRAYATADVGMHARPSAWRGRRRSPCLAHWRRSNSSAPPYLKVMER